jgi:hypothetical protein
MERSHRARGSPPACWSPRESRVRSERGGVELDRHEGWQRQGCASEAPLLCSSTVTRALLPSPHMLIGRERAGEGEGLESASSSRPLQRSSRHGGVPSRAPLGWAYSTATGELEAPARSGEKGDDRGVEEARWRRRGKAAEGGCKEERWREGVGFLGNKKKEETDALGHHGLLG